MKNKIVIVGAGPGGSSCAIWLKQLGYEVLLLDRQDKAGGLQLKNPYTNSWIATSPGATGASVVSALNESLKNHKVQARFNFEVSSIKKKEGVGFSVSGLCSGVQEEILADYVVLASGVSPKDLGLPDIVKRVKLIVGASAVFDDPSLIKGARVAVLGGGDSAFETVKKLNASGASEVYLFARNIKARPSLIEAAGAVNVIQDPTYVTDGSSVTWSDGCLTFDHIAVMYGFRPELDYAKNLSLAFNTNGFVQTDVDCRTSVEGVYAIGEISNRAHPCCVTAMSDGIVASKAIQREIEKNASATFAAIKRASSLFKALVHA